MKYVRVIIGVLLTLTGLGIVFWNFRPFSADAFLSLVAGGVVLIAGIALIGSRRLGDFIAKILKDIV
jgi:uncharacterized membrane protein HdeD (DUF308 family)